MPPLRMFTVSQICDIARRIHHWIEMHQSHFDDVGGDDGRIDLEEGARQIAEWLEWSKSSLENFHKHGRKYGCPPGANIFHFVLEDAKRYRTLKDSRPRLEKGKVSL